MSVDILGTSWDQCVSVVQCCFTSTETIILVRTESPGRPPRLLHSCWALRAQASAWICILVRGPVCSPRTQHGITPWTSKVWWKILDELESRPRRHRQGPNFTPSIGSSCNILSPTSQAWYLPPRRMDVVNRCLEFAFLDLSWGRKVPESEATFVIGTNWNLVHADTDWGQGQHLWVLCQPDESSCYHYNYLFWGVCIVLWGCNCPSVCRLKGVSFKTLPSLQRSLQSCISFILLRGRGLLLFLFVFLSPKISEYRA